MLVVVVQPTVQFAPSLGLRGVAAGVGPTVSQGAVEPLDLPIGLRTIRTGPLVPDTELGAGVSPQVRPIIPAVVLEDPLDGDASLVEPLDSSYQDRGRGECGFVVVDLGVGDAGVVVDDGVDVGLAH